MEVPYTVFTITGGTITNNISGKEGGGISLYREVGGTAITTANIKGGIIENNVSPNGTDMYASLEGGNGSTQIIDER